MNKRRALNLSVCCGLILGVNAVVNVNALAGAPVPMGPGAEGGAWAAGAMIGAGAIQNGGANGSVTVGAPPSNGRNCQEISPTYTTNNACGTGSYTYSTGSNGMQTMPAQNMAPQQQPQQ